MTIFLLCTSLGHRASAATACVLAVDGKYYVEGDCPVSQNDNTIMVGSDGKNILPYFAYLILESQSIARGFWNASPNAPHAHDDLGRLEKSGNCWIGDRARVCFNPAPFRRFSHAGWVGAAESGSCSMVQRFSDGKAEIVVEATKANDIGLGIRWLDGGRASVGQVVQATMYFDKAPALSATGTFVADNYLRFQSDRAGLLDHLFGASSGLRVEFGDDGWFTLNLRGSSKALALLRECQATVQFAQSQSEQVTSASAETFRLSERGIFRTTYGTWINVGDEYSRDRIAKFLSGLDVEYQFTYGEDCMECVNVVSGDIQLYFESGDGKTIQSIQVIGGSFTTERGDGIGDLISQKGDQLHCSDGMYEVCFRYERDSVGLIVDRSKCASDAFREGVRQASGNFLREFGQCERIEALIIQKPDNGSPDTGTKSTND
ncbi:hypothetical protein ACSBOB_26275 [Mesorhizobium sp. ASY16-5R]|uniref:hypothetical protein n=1 Tax=Mesorhizobium sp. ASY16-5R TaxID=3445772 RepID=UPI003FA06175